MNKLFVVKIGGNVLDDPTLLEKFLSDFTGKPFDRDFHYGLGLKFRVGQTLHWDFH